MTFQFNYGPSTNATYIRTRSHKINLTKENTREDFYEALKPWMKKTDGFMIRTSCGKFVILWKNIDRVSISILDVLCNTIDKTGDIVLTHSSRDHETFLFIHRYINKGIKINLDTLCQRLGIERQDALMLLNEWGYNEDICL